MLVKQLMRILLITRACNERSGGMERLSFELIQQLQQIPGLVVKVHKRNGTSRSGTVFFVFYSWPISLIRAYRADVVHLGDPVLALHGWLIKKLLRKPVAVTVHGLDVTFSQPLYQLYLKIFGQFDLALPISHHAEYLLFKSVVRCQLSSVINPGVQDRYFDPSINRLQLEQLLLKTARYKLLKNNSTLLTVGRLVARKGHAWFIKHVLPRLPATTLYLIAGTGPEKNALAKNARHRQQVLLLGHVNESQLKILYNTVDAFIQPNIFIAKDAEGFGLALLEAALCQRPVYAANLDGIPDAVHPGRNGTLLPAGDAAAWVAALKTPGGVAPAARTYTLQNFSWPAQAKKYLDQFKNLSH